MKKKINKCIHFGRQDGKWYACFRLVNIYSNKGTRKESISLQEFISFYIWNHPVLNDRQFSALVLRLNKWAHNRGEHSFWLRYRDGILSTKIDLCHLFPQQCGDYRARSGANYIILFMSDLIDEIKQFCDDIGKPVE